MVKIVLARCDHPYCQQIVAEWIYKQGDEMCNDDYCEYHAARR